MLEAKAASRARATRDSASALCGAQARRCSLVRPHDMFTGQTPRLHQSLHHQSLLVRPDTRQSNLLHELD